MADRVIIEDDAFEQLLGFTYGPLDVETTGLVSGELHNIRGGREFIIDKILPLQKVNRRKNDVFCDADEMERVRRFINCIGGYHSHPKANVTRPSKPDIKFIRDYYPDGIEVIVGLLPVKEPVKLEVDSIEIIGCLASEDGIYQITIGAYYLDYGKEGKLGRIKPARLLASERALRRYF